MDWTINKKTNTIYLTDTYAHQVVMIDGKTDMVVGTIPVRDGALLIRLGPSTKIQIPSM